MTQEQNSLENHQPLEHTAQQFYLSTKHTPSVPIPGHAPEAFPGHTHRSRALPRSPGRHASHPQGTRQPRLCLTAAFRTASISAGNTAPTPPSRALPRTPCVGTPGRLSPRGGHGACGPAARATSELTGEGQPAVTASAARGSDGCSPGSWRRPNSLPWGSQCPPPGPARQGGWGSSMTLRNSKQRSWHVPIRKPRMLTRHLL